MASNDEEFVQFAEAVSPRLRRAAFLLCGNWHTAQDLVQATLAKVFVAWRRINRREAAEAYAMRTLLNTFLADVRRRRPGEVLTAELPEQAAEMPAPELRLAVLHALATLPPSSRAVVVLRYWADMSVQQTAALLGCSEGNVKSQSSRALDKLRPMLGEVVTERGLAARPPVEPSRTGGAGHG
jgi:RNA polymerase sigma-70 factor (sigma-E family)